MRLLDGLLDLLTSKWVRVSGESMAPGLRNGQWVRVNRRVYRRDYPRRFDIVRFEAPIDQLRFDVKRIVGLPNELVELRDGELFVDGQPIAASVTGGGDAAWKTDEDQYVVVGDNRGASTDSRRYGPITFSSITGRVTQ